jgi:hypothetical protein
MKDEIDTERITPMTDRKTFSDIMNETHKFRHFGNAQSFAANSRKSMWVMMGGCDEERGGEYWVTTPANCSRLEKMGYEYAV